MLNLSTPTGARGRTQETDRGAWRDAPLSSIMTRNVAIVPEGLPLDELSRFLVGARTTSAAVSGDDGGLVGHVSMIDIVRQQCRAEVPFLLQDCGARPAVVRDIMRPFLLRVREDANIGKAAALMAFENIDRVFVVSPDGTVVGWVCALDVLRGAALHDGYPGISGPGVAPTDSSYAPTSCSSSGGEPPPAPPSREPYSPVG